MNTIYKVIWNDALRVYQVVNELCRSHRKACSVKAVHVQEHSVTESLKRGALITGSALALLTANVPSWASSIVVNQNQGFEWSLGTGQLVGQPIDLTGMEVNELPVLGTDDAFQINLDLKNVTLAQPTTDIFAQDEISDAAGLILIPVEYVNPLQAPSVEFIKDGVPTNSLTVDTGSAEFTYSVGTGFTQTSAGWAVGVTRKLTQINLNSAEKVGQYIDAATSQDTDLSAKITGTGNVTFGFTVEKPGEEGWLTLNSDTTLDDQTKVNDYTGTTKVGYNASGQASDITHLVFGMTEAFGDTSLLDVNRTSYVHFGGANGDKAYTQNVGALSGEGTLALGQKATLNLNQSSLENGQITAPVGDEPGKITISNLFTGASGATFNIALSDKAAGYEVVFEPALTQVSEEGVGLFTGLITLSDGSITSYQANTDVNEILTSSTLQLKDKGWVRVDSEGQLNNLIVDANAGGFEFSQLGNVAEDAALTINGDLTLNADANVYIKDFNFETLQGEAEGKSLLSADNGYLNTLVQVVEGDVNDNNHKLTLDDRNQQGEQASSIKNDPKGPEVASGYWVLEDDLRYNEDTQTYDLAYTLTRVDVHNNETLELVGDANASVTQDFIAQITSTGNGGVSFAAGAGATGSGTVIKVGNVATTEVNTYTGKTTVESGTTVVLTENSGFGNTSELLAAGNVTLNDNIYQKVGGIDETGTGTITLSQGSVLEIDAAGDQTINNIIAGAGSLNVDLGGNGASLIFNSDEQADQFKGNLTLSNGRFSLDAAGSNATIASGAGSIVLDSGATFDFGSGNHQVNDLTIKADSKLESAGLIIGAPNAQLTTGNLALESNATITLTGVSVQDNLSLIGYDQASVSQSFIDAESVTGPGSLTLSGSGDFSSLDKLVLDYKQNGILAAETVWTVDPSLTQEDNSFKFGAQLKEIHLINNTVISGSGQELTALIKDSDEEGAHSIQFSLVTGENAETSSQMTVNNAANSYTGATTVDQNVTVTLASDNAFGKTSALNALGDVILNEDVEQAIGGLKGSGKVELKQGAVLSLTQSSKAEIDNILSGNGTFAVNLGGSTNALTFTNESSSAFGGTVKLASGSLALNATDEVTQKVMGTASLDLGQDGVLQVIGTDTYQGQLKQLTLDGGSRLDFGAVNFGADEDRAQLLVSGAMHFDGENALTFGGINLDGTTNILAAADQGLKQALLTATGGITSGDGAKLEIEETEISPSQIKNAGSDASDPVAAYGVWTALGANAVTIDQNTIYAAVKLDEIQLALDNAEGLILDLTGQNATLSAKLTNSKETAGDITFSGSGALTITGTGNDFTGGAYVEGDADIILGENNALGHASLLSVSGAGSTVDFNGKTQLLGQILTTDANALTGSGSITLDGQGLTSKIVGANVTLNANISLTNAHKLDINDVAGIGSSGTLTLGNGTSLNMHDITSGTFLKGVAGSGSVQIDNSTLSLAANNSGFTGSWLIGTSSTATTDVQGAADAIDQTLGSGATVNLGQSGSLTLKLADAESTLLSIDEIFTGAGLLTVEGTAGTSEQSFAFKKDFTGFSGTLALSNIDLSVGGTADHNAGNLANADLILSNGAAVSVSGNVNTFDQVTVADGQSGTFILSGLGFSTTENPLAGTNQITVGSIDLKDGQKINVQVNNLASGADLLGDVSESNLISSGLNPFQTLIAIENGIELNGGKVTDRFALIGANVADTFTQEIKNGTSTVASGYYSIGLALDDSTNHNLGVQYELERVDILSTLTLSESGTLGAQITSDNASGNLVIAENGVIELTNSGNKYTGDTTVQAGGKLTAGERALGFTDDLLISGTYINTGANTVNRLEVAQSETLLQLDAGLSLKHENLNDGVTSSIAGVLSGAGNVSLGSGELDIIANAGTKYTGTVVLGDFGKSTDAVLKLSGASGLGSGKIAFTTADSRVEIEDDQDVLFKNEMSGQGVISVSLVGSDSSARDFAFGSNQQNLGNQSELILDKANFDLTASDSNFNDDVAQKLVITVNQGSTLANDGSANKTIAGLNLNGGTVDLGALESGTGQISLNGGELTIADGSTNTIVLDSQAQTTESGDRTLSGNGQELLAGGLFDLTIFSNVSDVNDEVLGAADASGNQTVGGLTTDSGFSGTSENLFQDADGDGQDDFVATMTRDSGAFYYNDDKDNVFLQYTFKQINLLWTASGEGLTIDATGKTDANLSAQVTGDGNLILGGTLSVGGSESDNSYSGSTYVKDDAHVSLAQNNAFGQTKQLDLAGSGSVTLKAGLQQTVGALTGSGNLYLESGASFTLRNAANGSSGAQAITINNNIAFAENTTGDVAKFLIDGAYGADGSGKATLEFVHESNLSNIALTLQNTDFTISSLQDVDYLTSHTAQDFVIGQGQVVHLTADAAGAYEYNELSFENGGELKVSGVTLTTVDESTNDAVIHTDVLDISGSGTLSVAAEIDDSFDLLKNDSDTYQSTIISFDKLVGDPGVPGDPSNPGDLKPSPNLAASELKNADGDTLAHVGWDGSIVWSDSAAEGQSGTVGMEYKVANVQLSMETGNGLELKTDNSGDAVLSAKITDYAPSVGETVYGNIAFTGGAITVNNSANDYHGETRVTSGSVTFAANNGFGNTSLLEISNGAYVDIAGYTQSVDQLTILGSNGLSGSGTITLVGDNVTSTVKGDQSFTGTIAFDGNAPHTLVLDGTAGLDKATVAFKGLTGTDNVYSEALVLQNVSNDAFGTTLTGKGLVTLTDSTDVTITGNNSGFGGDWFFQSGSTATVNGSDTRTANDILGHSGTVTLSTADDTLTLSQTGDTFEIDNAFAGTGRLEVLGTGAGIQSFDFSRNWRDEALFEGTLALSNDIKLAVGKTGTSAYNVANLANANIEITGGSFDSFLTVESGGLVETFKDVTVGNGATIEFNSQLAIHPENTFGSLKIGGELTVADGQTGNIFVRFESGASGDRTVDDLKNTAVVSEANDGAFLTLVDGTSGTVDVSKWTLNDKNNTELSNSEVSQTITQGDDAEPVADAIYSYQISNGDGTDLGIAFNMKTIEIYKDKELELTEDGSLGVLVSGSGSLLISSNNEGLTLTGENKYLGTTTVTGKLTANESGLGYTSGLILKDGAEFTNTGANVAGYFSGSAATMTLDGELTLSGAQESSITDGTLNGEGALNVDSNTLTVSGVVSGDYSGVVTLGTADTDATLALTNGAAGLGSGLVAFANEDSQATVNGNASLTLSNFYSGNGVINVDLGSSDSVFAFSTEQKTSGNFTGTLLLSNATYNLYEDQSLANATLTAEEDSVVNVNTTDNTADRNVGSLALNGGELNFGELSFGSESGQIVVSKTGTFGINTDGDSTSKTNISVSLADKTESTGASLFDAHSGQSVLLIEGFDASNTELSGLSLESSASLKQNVIQANRRAANDLTAELTYADGELKGTGDGIEAGWTLSQIELKDASGEGLLIDASAETDSSGQISALIIGSGNVEFGGGAITLSNDSNKFTGKTAVTNGTTLNLAADEALGDTASLDVENGTVAFNGTSQTIGAINVTDSGHFTMAAGGSLTLSGDSVIASQNTGAAAGALNVSGTAGLELQDADAAGALTLTASQNASIAFTQFGSEGGYGVVDNELHGSGTYYIGDSDGENAAYVNLTNTDNDFEKLYVRNQGHLLIDGMHNDATALNDAALVLDSGAYAELNGDSGWSLVNTLAVDEGAELAVSAGGIANEFSFGGTNQTINGKVTFTELVTSLGDGSVLTSANVVAGNQAHVKVEQGDAAQQVAGFTLSNGAEITFEGSLGVGNVGSRDLGQLAVSGALTLDTGSTVHVEVVDQTGAASSVAQNHLVQTANEGTFQNLITAGSIAGTAVDDEGRIVNGSIALKDFGGNDLESVAGSIMDGTTEVAVGTFGPELQINGNSFGVHYGLQAIDIVGNLTISESGTFAIDIASTKGTGSLTISSSEELTLSGENSYTVATNVTGVLTAAEGGLGTSQSHTQSLTIGGHYTNAGANIVGDLESSGTFTLGALLTVTNATDGASHITAGMVEGSGGLTVNSGSLTVATGNTSGYEGTVTLGSGASAASMILEQGAGAKFGSGTIAFANEASALRVNTNAPATLGNLLSGVGLVSVSGASGENFSFKTGQNAEDGPTFTGELALSNVAYDFTNDANDILKGVSLTVNDGTTLVVNNAQDTANRLVNGMSLNGGAISYRTIGNGTGYIDLQGQTLTAEGNKQTTLSFETNLADRNDAFGNAAFEGVIDDSLVLIGNVSADTANDVLKGLSLEPSGSGFTRDLVQGGVTTARIHGTIGDLALSTNDGTKNVEAGLTNKVLELVVGTYGVHDSGTIALQVSGTGNLGVYDKLTLTNTANSYTGDTIVSGDGAVLTLGADQVLGQTDSHTDEVSVSNGAQVEFGSTSQIIGSINATGNGALSSDQKTSGKLTIENGGSVTGANTRFHTEIELADGSADLKLGDAEAIGSASVNVIGEETDVVLSGFSGEFANNVTGSGGLTIAAVTDVSLTGENTFTGDLTVKASGSVTAAGDVDTHIGSGGIVLLGTADFTQTEFTTGEEAWNWNRNVSGDGSLSLSDAGHELVLESGLADFAGKLSLGDLKMTLSSDGAESKSLKTIANSNINHLVLESGSDLHLDGATMLGTHADAFNVTMQSGGSFVFEGIAVPGSENDTANSTHLTIDGTLTLESGFELSLSTEADAKVDQSKTSLLKQDDSGMRIDVITANDITGAEVSTGTVTLDGGRETTFDILGKDAQGNPDVVATGHYDFDIVSGSSGAFDTISLEYKLDEVSIIGGKKLELEGSDDETSLDNTLSAKVTGEGNLAITGGKVTLAGKNDYTGTTTVTEGASLYAQSGALGWAKDDDSVDEMHVTASLDVESGSKAYIVGSNVVKGLDIADDSELNIGGDDDSVSLTLRSSTSETVPANHIYGMLEGSGTLRVFGNGTVDKGVESDLTIHGSQELFDGDVQLENGAWVTIAADSSNLFGNSTIHTNIGIDEKSKLTISSTYDGEGSFAGIFTNIKNENGEEKGGTVEISMADESNLFRFTTAQDTAGFNGTFVLDRGTVDYTKLYSSQSGGSGTVLEDAMLQLNAEGNLVLAASGKDGGVSHEAHLGGLTLTGGNIAFGSINYNAADDSAVAGAHASHINLGGDGVLRLQNKDEDEKAVQSTITVAQNETNRISDSGTELLAADDGTSIVLIHNIGSIALNDDVDPLENPLTADLSDYLVLDNEAGEQQLLEQKLRETGEYADVAEVVRTFNENLTVGKSTVEGEDNRYEVSLGYHIDYVGLRHATGEVTAENYGDYSLWQGLTITTSDSDDPARNQFNALIANGSNGVAGNLVLRGNENAKDSVLTLTGAETAEGGFSGNTYTGKTWVTGNANIAFGADNAFGTTEALRIDNGSTVDFAGHIQTVGELFALGDDALTGDVNLTVSGDALINEANTNLGGKVAFEQDATINNVVGLGSAEVTLSGTTSKFTIENAKGDAGGAFKNVLVGGTGTTVNVANSDISLSTDQLTAYQGQFDIDGSDVALAITNTDSGSTVLGNVINVDDTGTLSVSMKKPEGSFIFAKDTNIAGKLEISSGGFNLSEEQNTAALDHADLAVNAGGRVSVSTDIGSETVDNLALNDKSTLVFAGGATPGSAGLEDTQGHIDLGESGKLAVTGQVTVEADVDLVNADLVAEKVADAKDKVTNIPLTAYDVIAGDQTGEQLANLISAGTVEGTNESFELKVTGGTYQNESLQVGIFNSDDSTVQVATGTFDYKATLDDNGLNLSYGLTGVNVSGGRTLTLTGYDSDATDNTLAIAVTGEGGLRIDAGTITLTGNNNYFGETIVEDGAELVTGIGGHSLGQTSKLSLVDKTGTGASGATATINGDEAVGGLRIDSKSTLTLGAAGEGDLTELTINNTNGQKSTVDGHIVGGADSLITIKGNSGDYTDLDLVVTSRNDDFYGDITLEDAYVRLESMNSFGADGTLTLNEHSTLEINSNADDAQKVEVDGTVYSFHKFDNLISGDGTVRISLDDAEDYFDFAEAQYDYKDGDNQAFTGTLELAVGKFKFTDRKADVLQSVHVVLDGDATLDISTDTSETQDRNIRGLTLASGTLEFGSLALDREQAEARATHINLKGNDLRLEDADRQVEISFRQDATNYISDKGSEVVNASDADGSKIVLIHNIGNLYVDGQNVAVSDEAQAVLQDYLKHELADNTEDQVLHQSIASADQPADVQQVARVDRDFGAFGYADMADQKLGNALYVGYEINSIELLYRGSNNDVYGDDGAWKGLTVSSSDLSNQLTAQLNGQGNLVITGGANDPLKIGNADGAENNYTGRTWVTGGADVEFAANNAFGETSHLRVDAGSSVDFGNFTQTVGSLITYDDHALVGDENAVLTITGSATIYEQNTGFKGSLVFNTEQSTTGTVADAEGLGQGNVSIGQNYTLVITDENGTIDNDIHGVDGQGGVLQIGTNSKPTSNPQSTGLSGENAEFNGTIRVENGWTMSAAVGKNDDGSDESVADRLGTGVLDLVAGSTADITFDTENVVWNHTVTGSGTLTVSGGADKSVNIEGGLGDSFDGTFVVGGGRFDLASNADKLGNGNVAATGGDAAIVIEGETPVEFGKNVTVSGSDGNRGQLVFDDLLNLGDAETAEPELVVGDNLTLNGAHVSVKVDGELDAGMEPGEALDMNAITMADEGAIKYVIAEAGLIEVANTTLSIENIGTDNKAEVDITNNGQKVATGTYDFGLGVSTDRKQLGLSYQLVSVDVESGVSLALSGANEETKPVDWVNASEFSADIVGAGGIELKTGELTLTGAGNAYEGSTTVRDGAVLTVESSLGNTSAVTVDEGGRLVNASNDTTAGMINVSGRLDLEEGSKLALEANGESVVNGVITGTGTLQLDKKASIAVNADNGYETFTGTVAAGNGAEYSLVSNGASAVTVRTTFADKTGETGGTVRFDKAEGATSANYALMGSAVDFTGTFKLGANVAVSATNIAALGGEGSELLITTDKKGDTYDKATLRFEYDDELIGQNDSLLITQGMTSGITFEKTGDGVLELSDNAMGAGAVKVEEGGAFFGEAGQTDAFDTDLTVGEDGWAAGFGGVGTLTVERGGSFYVGGRAGYNSILSNGVATLAEGDESGEAIDDGNTVSFTVNGDVNNKGVIYVGSKTDEGSAPADSSYIGNELVIKGDYNVTASDNGGIFDMNAVIAGNDKSSADHVTITGKINGEGYIDVNYDEKASTGGELEYLGLVSVNGGDDGESLKLKDKIKIGDLWYRLMWSSDENEYYLQSSVTDPGDGSWDTEDVENVGGGARSALALMQVQTFDLSIHDHIGETLYVDPVTGEERKTTFWMIQRGDWTKFDNASGQLNADGHVYTTHLGSDLITRNTDNGTVRWGLLGSFADGDFDISSSLDGKTAQGSFRGYSVGGYWAFESSAESGPFAALQLRYNWFDNENGKDEYDVDGISITAEAGYDKLLSKGTTSSGRTYEWRVEPHVRAYWTNYGDPDDYTTPLGETYSSSFDNGMMVRVGARTKIASMKGTGPAVQAYAEANWVYNNGDYSTTVSTKYGDVTSTQEGANFAELRLGLEAQFTPKVNLWVEGHHQTGSDNYESSGAMIGFKYRW